MTIKTSTPALRIPRHVAVIMDGNGRWGQQRGLPRLAGHQAGTENIHNVVQTFVEYGVSYLTLFAFSTENWARPSLEVNGLFGILRDVIARELKVLHSQGVRLRHIGRLDRLPAELRRKVSEAVKLTQDNDRLTLSVAFDYGGRAEILEAVQRMLLDQVAPEDVDEALFRKYLYTMDLPDPDLIIRTAGELRLSNFLLWQSAYSEYYYTSAAWPDFNSTQIHQAMHAYSQRERRFGKLRPEG